jgi:redox-regulated HSP33 family molecular chaperone
MKRIFKYKKAMEFLSKRQFTYYYNEEFNRIVNTLIILAEQEIDEFYKDYIPKEKAVEAYCKECNERTGACPCGYPSVCYQRDEFINQLNR